MFNLMEAELQASFEAIEHHGYSTMLPTPSEWKVVQANWSAVKQYLSQIDLDTHEPHKSLRVFAPKSRANVRVVHLLHPEDLLIYTALVLIVKDDLERARISRNARRIFSYRTKPGVSNRLYDARGSHDAYLFQLKKKAEKVNVKFVGLADIADFYSRIYQHRLENIIQTTATTQRGNDVARVLVKKLIAKLMGRNSYGIPVGPYASRLLGEAVLIDVDEHLKAKGVDYVRWVDDYNIFANTEFAAQRTLFELAEWLYTQHGLTLQATKTKILPVDNFVSEVLTSPEESVTDRDRVIQILQTGAFENEYDDEDEQRNPDEEEVQRLLEALQAYDLHKLLKESISDAELVDYEVVRYVLTRLPRIPGADEQLKLDLLDLILDKAELLYPAAEFVASYVLTFNAMPAKRRRVIAKKLFKPLKSKTNPPPDYYAMWVLHIFSTSSVWNHTSDIRRLYETENSDVVKRYAALAIATCGARADALVVKDDLDSSASMLRLAILSASKLLGPDERKHWKLSHQFEGIVEKYV